MVAGGGVFGYFALQACLRFAESQRSSPSPGAGIGLAMVLALGVGATAVVAGTAGFFAALLLRHRAFAVAGYGLGSGLLLFVLYGYFSYRRTLDETARSVADARPSFPTTKPRPHLDAATLLGPWMPVGGSILPAADPDRFIEAQTESELPGYVMLQMGRGGWSFDRAAGFNRWIHAPLRRPGDGTLVEVVVTQQGRTTRLQVSRRATGGW